MKLTGENRSTRRKTCPSATLCTTNPTWTDQFFFILPSNGAPVEWNWQGKTEVLGEKPVPVPLCPPQIPHGLVSFFLIFPSNGAPVEWTWQGKTEVLGEKPVPVPLCPPQIPHGLTRDRTRASAARCRQLTAWAMARPHSGLAKALNILGYYDVSTGA
jgi:hypothetical protein